MAAGCALALLGCGSQPEPRDGNDRVTRVFKQGFSGPIIGSSGARIGTVAGTLGEKGLIVRFEVSGLTPGMHGVHLHEAGRCDPPGFESAGAHWDSAGRQHGYENPKGPHDGDWDNLEVAADGRGSTDRLIPRWHGRIPQSGLALVIHANRDDERTDPSGNSGARIACGVVIPPG